MAGEKDEPGGPPPLWLMTEEHFAFLAIKKTDDPLVSPPFAIGSEEYVRQVVDRWQNGEEPKEESDQVEEPELKLDDSQESTLSSALTKAVEFSASQSHLIAVTTAAPTIFNYVHVRSNVLDPIVKNCAPIIDDGTVSVYGMDQNQHEDFDKARKALLDLRLGIAALPNATLMSLVASFDALVTDLVARMLRLDKSWMERSDRKLSFDKLAQAISIDDLITNAIREELYQFSRGSHDEQAKFIESNFGIAIRSHWRRWPDYIEVFERRNLIAHGETNFNSRYVSIYAKALVTRVRRSFSDRILRSDRIICNKHSTY